MTIGDALTTVTTAEHHADPQAGRHTPIFTTTVECLALDPPLRAHGEGFTKDQAEARAMNSFKGELKLRARNR